MRFCCMPGVGGPERGDHLVSQVLSHSPVAIGFHRLTTIDNLMVESGCGCYNQ